jgi:ketosteroid isomerase-like protein
MSNVGDGSRTNEILTTDDVVAIQQLLALYGHAADSPTQDLLAQVFTEDAVFQSGVRDLRMEGLSEIQRWFAQGKPPHAPAHQTTNVYVYCAHGEVKVKSKFLAISHTTGLPRTGDYEDVVRRTTEGWRIARRTSFPRFGEP